MKYKKRASNHSGYYDFLKKDLIMILHMDLPEQALDQRDPYNN